MFMFSSLACHLRYALIILCILVVIILFSKWTGYNNNNTKTIQIVSPNNNDTTITTLIYHAQELCRSVMEQLKSGGGDKAYLTQQLTYALAYIDSAQMLASDADIEKITKTQSIAQLIANTKELQEHIVQNLE
jgi:hypothetical protein